MISDFLSIMGPIKWQRYCPELQNYEVVINNFAEKMEEYVKERKIYSEEFEVGGTTFSLDIFPNYGNGYVAIFLNNESSHDVKVSARFEIDNMTRILDRSTIKARGNKGFPKLYPSYEAFDKTDIELVVIVDIFEVELLNQQQTTNNPAAKSESKLETLTIDQVNQKLQSLNAVETKVAALENKVAALETKLMTKIEKPKCPYCFEDFNSTTKIAQCLSGHLVCWSCNQRNNKRNCGLCQQPDNGRCFGMESYLRSMDDGQ